MIGWIILGVLAVVVYFIIGFLLAGFYYYDIPADFEVAFAFIWPVWVPLICFVKIFNKGFKVFSDLGMDCREKLKNRRKK